MYDLLYTKAAIVYSPLGILFRVISFIASVTALVLFSVIIDIHAYSSIDVSITYILLIGAVVLEVYAFCVLLFSDWTVLLYAGLKKTNPCATFSCHSILANRKKWSRSMAQYSLVSSCLHKIQPRWFGVQKLPWIGGLLEKYQCLSWVDVDKDIKEMIFKQLKEKSNEIKDDHFSFESCRKLLARSLEEVIVCLRSMYFMIFPGARLRISKCLSDYILYLLVFNPTMPPEGIGEIRFAKQLKSLEIDNNQPNKWEVISEVWVEMLTYASNKCRWKEHGQQLQKGGELLTHVRLLMVHLVVVFVVVVFMLLARFDLVSAKTLQAREQLSGSYGDMIL
ncbi:hypothetical protein Q3G72_030073 [Acer saccharum]|nr:hypothetical protein Q3G72_030073 [Acer saccharum]